MKKSMAQRTISKTAAASARNRTSESRKPLPAESRLFAPDVGGGILLIFRGLEQASRRGQLGYEGRLSWSMSK
jgi:hypothetical protein